MIRQSRLSFAITVALVEQHHGPLVQRVATGASTAATRAPTATTPPRSARGANLNEKAEPATVRSGSGAPPAAEVNRG